MKEESKKILEKLELLVLIDARLENIQRSITNLKKEQLSKDLQELFTEIVVRKRLQVSQIMNEFKITRNWALNRMRKLASEFPQIEFHVGNHLRKTESVLLYSDIKETEIILKRILCFMENKKSSTFAEINKLLIDLIGNDINRTRIYINKLVKNNEDKYWIEGENKLVKK